MSRNRFVGLLVVGTVLAGVLPLDGGQQASRPQQPQAAEIEQLVSKLGSSRFRERAEAERKLLELEGDALPALRKATSASDLEVRRRVKHMIEQIRRRQDERELRGRLAWGVDAFIEAMILHRK